MLFGLQFDQSKIFWEALVIVIPFSSFKRITHEYLQKLSITHNKNRIPLLNLLIICASARYPLQILSIKGECTFIFSDILIFGFYNSLANSLFDIFSFFIAPPEANLSANKADCLSKELNTFEVSPRWYPSYFVFLAILNALSCHILSETVLLVKSLKYL